MVPTRTVRGDRDNKRTAYELVVLYSSSKLWGPRDVGNEFLALCTERGTHYVR